MNHAPLRTNSAAGSSANSAHHESANTTLLGQGSLTRRHFLGRSALGLGSLTIASLLNPDAVGAATDGTVEIPKVAQPGYLESYVDPVFGATVTRITGDPGTDIPNVGGKWGLVERHFYSKIAAFNCDGSILFLGKRDGQPGQLFLDGSTYRPLFRRDLSFSEARWHPKESSVMVYVEDNAVGYWDVREDKTRTIATFEGYSRFRIGPGEGNLSRDGRSIVVVGRKGTDRVAFAYDLQEKRKWPDLVLNDVFDIDWVSASASGKFMVFNGGITARNGDESQIYDLEGNKVGELWGQYGRPSHYDLTIDDAGDDVAVGVSKSEPDAGRVIKRRLHDGKVTVLTSGGYATHISARNVTHPGWAYVTFQDRGLDWPPYRDEVVAVKLDGSMTVERIAHLHTHRTDYATEAHAVPSSDGKRVLWASNWESSSGRPIGAYVAHVRAANEG